MVNNEVSMNGVSVIISSHRTDGILWDCIRSLWKQSVKPLEVIVSVDSKEDALRLYLENSDNLNIILVYSGATGPTCARNSAITRAKGDIIAFIDDDAIAGDDWIKNIMETFERCRDASVIGGPVSPMFTSEETVPERWWWIIGCTSDTPQTNRPISCNMAIRAKVFEKNGMFEEVGKKRMDHPMSEETEFCERVLASGECIIWGDNITVFHNVPKERTTLSYMMNRGYKEGVGKSVIHEKYKSYLEKHFLKYYLTHPDMYTIPVVGSVAYGYLRGKLLK
jgi:GT2 family glycosyltransferase